MIDDSDTTAAEIRRLLAGGWLYATRQVEPEEGSGGVRVRPGVVFRLNGRERVVRSRNTWPLGDTDDAWLWCDNWAHRASLWAQTPDAGLL